MKDGIERIKEERERQISKEGYDKEHDEKNEKYNNKINKKTPLCATNTSEECKSMIYTLLTVSKLYHTHFKFATE